jgi:hypothetical protein
MQIEYKISEQDFLDAQKLAIRNLPSRSTRLIFRVLPFWGLFLFLGVMWPVFQHGLSWKWNMLLPFSMALLFLSLPLLMRRAQKKIYRKTANLHGKRTVTVEGTGLNFNGPGFSSHVEWAFFPRFVEDENTFLLYQSNQIFNIIPKRQLSQNQISELREAFTQHIITRN